MCCCQKSTEKQTDINACAVPVGDCTHCAKQCNKQSNDVKNYFDNPLLNNTNATPIVRSDYEQMWDLLRAESGGILIKTVPRTIPTISYDKAKAWLKALELAEYVLVTDISAMNAVCATYRYQLVRDIGQQPPRIDSKGQVKPPQSSDLIWRTLRILKNANAHQIVASGSTPELTLKISNVRQYLRALYLAGYLKADSTRHSRALAGYQLIKNTGPKAPQVKRGKKVYDANLGIIVYDPGTALPPAHQAETDQSKQKQAAKKRAKKNAKESRHV